METLRSLTVGFLLFGPLFGVTKAQLPKLPTKPLPTFEPHSFCPPEGTLSTTADPDLNRRKNRIDESLKYHLVSVEDLLQLPGIPELANKKRSDWESAQANTVSEYEGIPIVILGFLVVTSDKGQPFAAKLSARESCNCWSTEPEHRDITLLVSTQISGNKKNTVVAKITPRVRKLHPQWTLGRLTQIGQQHLPVLLYGWLMLDQDSIKQVGRSRATAWELHPVIQIEVKENGVWKTL